MHIPLIPRCSLKNTRGFVGARTPTGASLFASSQRVCGGRRLMVSGRDRRKETGDELASLPSSSSHVSEEEMPILAKTNCYTCARHVTPPPPPTHTHQRPWASAASFPSWPSASPSPLKPSLHVKGSLSNYNPDDSEH